MAQRTRAVAAVITATRLDCDVKQSELARRLHWSRSKVTKIENGEVSVRAVELIAIAEVLGVDPEDVWRRILRW